MGKIVCILFLFALVVTALAAPKEDEPAKTTSEVEAPKNAAEKKTSSTERDVLVADDTWSGWMSKNSMTLAYSGGTGLIIILALAGGFYYYYYVMAVQNTGYAQGHSLNYNTQPNQYYGYQGTQYPSRRRRALDGDVSRGTGWDFTKVLQYIEIAQKTYEGFDWQNIECQKKILCELSQKDNWAGETGRQITDNYLLKLVDALDGIPIPRLIQVYLEEFKGAIMQGKNSNKECGSVYKKCKFSIAQVIAAAGKKKPNTL